MQIQSGRNWVGKRVVRPSNKSKRQENKEERKIKQASKIVPKKTIELG